MTAEPTPTLQPARRRRLPATTLPAAREDRRGWSVLSALVHALIIALLLVPLADHDGLVIERPQGAGGAGPAGGGGGGRRGSGGAQETVHYIRVAAAPAPTAQPTVTPPPKPVPTPKPVVPPVVKPPEITPQTSPAPKLEIAKLSAATAPVSGVGGGTGSDGSAGSGPGSGGGVGSGVGTGRGSANGPGTGGGIQANYPPTATELFIPPLPMPDKVRGFHLVAEFDVDSTGKVLGFNFTHTGDRGYDKRLSEVLGATKFRPGTKPDGTPIRMKAQIIYDF